MNGGAEVKAVNPESAIDVADAKSATRKPFAPSAFIQRIVITAKDGALVNHDPKIATGEKTKRVLLISKT